MWTFYVCVSPRSPPSISPPWIQQTLRDPCQSDLPPLCFLVLCSLWPLRNPPNPLLVLIWRGGAAKTLFESRLFAPRWNFCRKATRLLLVEFLTVERKVVFPWFSAARDSTVVLFDRPSSREPLSLICAVISPPFPPVPPSSAGTSCRLTSLLLIHCCLQSHLFTFSLYFSFAALRNQLFCIYFIAIWAFSDLFFLISSSPPPPFIFFFCLFRGCF